MKFIKIYFAILVVLTVAACSPKKNTWRSRAYNDFAVKYNIRFNANSTFKEAQMSLIESNTDDYTEILSLYPIVTKETVGGITSQMNTTIEKCRKAIKLHSIRSKPSKKPWRMSDREYRAYREQEEFNPQVPQAWLLLGKAEYYKADFIEAISAFNYAIRHYPENERVVYEAQLWKLRAYSDMGWFNEAESYFSSIKPASVPTKLKPLYMAFAANLMLKQERYNEAITYLKQAIEGASNKYEKARFNFVIAQLYERTGNNNIAKEHYIEAQRNATNYEMIFNSRLKSLQLETNMQRSIKSLQRMAKSSNNQQYLDQIYYAIGNKYLFNNQTDKAIENYKLAMVKSTRNGIEKALVALRIAELYYDKKEYVPSWQYYDSVLVVMPNTHYQYKEAENRATTLGELVQNYKVVELQDSLLRLSMLSDAEQRRVVDRIIKNLIAEEQRQAKDSANKAALAVASSASIVQTSDPMAGRQISGGSLWYFYNSSSVNQGKSDFRRRWGNRPLEDSWNRQVKSPAMANIDYNETTSNDTIAQDGQPTDSVSNDLHDPQYYLSQIPKTDEDKQKANSLIATALYNMGNIFYTKMDDLESADDTYRQFQNRFPTDERKPETYFIEYQINGKLEKHTEQQTFREKLMNEYPTSKYAVMLANPNYAENMRRMLEVQDEFYAETYKAYINDEHGKVRQNYARIITDYPMSEHLPKFAFLNALSSAKLGMRDTLEVELDTIIARYPTADITPISKDILALIRQGREQQALTAKGDDINERRNKEAEIEITNIRKEAEKFSVNITEGHNVLLVPIKNDKNLLNNMLYDIAAYNFNKFMVKDFDFDILLLGSREVLVISGMESLEESNWYRQLIATDSAFAGLKLLNDFVVVAISNSNLAQIQTEANLENYLKFETQKGE